LYNSYKILSETFSPFLKQMKCAAYVGYFTRTLYLHGMSLYSLLEMRQYMPVYYAGTFFVLEFHTGT
jgi:hypothetical protein